MDRYRCKDNTFSRSLFACNAISFKTQLNLGSFAHKKDLFILIRICFLGNFSHFFKDEENIYHRMFHDLCPTH